MDTQILTADNVWGFATAMILMVIYCVPVQSWGRWIGSYHNVRNSRRSSPEHTIQQSTKVHECNKPSIHKVTFVSPLPHPPTDTTEVSEETETSSENECYIIEEVSRTPAAGRPFTPQQQQHHHHQPTRPVQFIQPIRLEDIPESPCPALNAALNLKNKLLRQDAVCNRTVSGSTAGSSSAHKHRRSSTVGSIRTLPNTPTDPGRLRKHRSLHSLQESSTTQRDSQVLRRLSRVGSTR